MAQQQFFKQVTLTKGATSEVAWIPEEFAKVGKFLRIEDDNGWQVEKVGSRRMSGVYLAEHEREYLRHRKVTDI